MRTLFGLLVESSVAAMRFTPRPSPPGADLLLSLTDLCSVDRLINGAVQIRFEWSPNGGGRVDTTLTVTASVADL